MSDLYQDPFRLDATPLDSDFTDIKELLDDLRKHAQEHPDWEYLCADDPGCNHNPPRVPRMGWSGSPKEEPDEGESKQWTIKVSALKNTTWKMADTELATAMKSASARKLLLERVIERPGHTDASGPILRAEQATEEVIAAWEAIENLERGRAESTMEWEICCSAPMIVRVLKSLIILEKLRAFRKNCDCRVRRNKHSSKCPNSNWLGWSCSDDCPMKGTDEDRQPGA